MIPYHPSRSMRTLFGAAVITLLVSTVLWNPWGILVSGTVLLLIVSHLTAYILGIRLGHVQYRAASACSSAIMAHLLNKQQLEKQIRDIRRLYNDRESEPEFEWQKKNS